MIKTLRTPLQSILAIIVLIAMPACFGEVTGMDYGEGYENSGTSPGDYDTEAPGNAEACFGEGISTSLDEPCTVSSECESPLVCVQGDCVPTMAEGIYCDPLDGRDCPNAGDFCAAGLCTTLPDSCDTSADCPTDFVCSRVDDGKQCVPREDTQRCTDTGAGPNLTGTWQMRHDLNVREGLQGTIDSFLGATEKLRDVIEGTWDGGNFFEQVAAAFAGAYLSEVFRSMGKEYVLDFVTHVGDIGEILSNVKVEATVKVVPTDCKGTYRATQTWDYIVVKLRNVEKRFAPSIVPYVGAVRPDDSFSMRYHCGQLYFDRHRISSTVTGLARYTLDLIAQATTEQEDFRSAIGSLISCSRVKDAAEREFTRDCPGPLADPAGYATCRAAAYTIATAAEKVCEAARDATTAVFVSWLDQEISETADINLQGVATSVRDRSIRNGIWNASLESGDFSGTFEMDKQ